MQKGTNCENCTYYVYDEIGDYYVCEMNLDEDEMRKFMTSSYYNCPYFRFEDDYTIVKKQM